MMNRYKSGSGLHRKRNFYLDKASHVGRRVSKGEAKIEGKLTRGGGGGLPASLERVELKAGKSFTGGRGNLTAQVGGTI